MEIFESKMAYFINLGIKVNMISVIFIFVFYSFIFVLYIYDVARSN